MKIPQMSVSKIDQVVNKLKSICERHKPNITYIFYFPWKNGPESVCGIRKPSKKFSLIAHIIRSKGELEDAVKAHIETYGNDPMEEDENHTGNYNKIFTSVQQLLSEHCEECKKKWDHHIIADGIANPDIDSWNDYVREVVLLRTTIERAQFCISADEHFPHADDLLEFGSEYTTRAEEVFSLFEFLGDTTYYFAMEYWERQDQKMTIWKSASGDDLPGTKYLNEKM